MNVFIKALLIGVAAVGSVGHAQDPGATAPPAELGDVGGGGGSEMTAVEMADKLIESEGLYSKGESKDYVIVGRDNLPCLPSNPSFDKCLTMAYMGAMLNAKQEMSELLGAAIESEVSKVSLAGSEMFKDEGDGAVSIANRAAINALRGEAAKAMPHLLAQLKNAGKNVDDPAVVEEARTEAFQGAAKKLMGTTSYKNMVRTIARSEVAGMFSKQCFVSTQGNGDVAVVCRLTPKSRQMVEVMLGKDVTISGTKKMPISAWARSIGKEKLAFTFGVQPRSNENGELCIVAFGQASPKQDTSIQATQAQARARLYAQQALRQFAGEMVVANSLVNESMDVADMSDAAAEIATDDAFRQEITAKAESLKLTGIETAYEWEGTHPLTGKKVHGVVMYWNLSNNKGASEMRDMLNSLGGSRGGDGASNLKSNRQGTGSSPAQPTPRKKAGEGVNSDSDDE